MSLEARKRRADRKADGSDRVERIEHPACGGTLCALNMFVKSQKWAREEASWEVCRLRDGEANGSSDGWAQWD